MDLDISSMMMILFILFMIVGIWKVYVFLPNKILDDDDKTQEAIYELRRLMLKIINKKKGQVNNQELFLAISEDEDFDSKLFWRFNQNRLNQLLKQYFIENPHAKSIEDIYKDNT